MFKQQQTISAALKSKMNASIHPIRVFLGGRKYSKDFAKIHTYCMFIGYPRSGHTLVGSLLDAHPNIIITNEMDALVYLKRGISRKEFFYRLLEHSQSSSLQMRSGGAYSYLVARQWNGRYQDLRIIGDQKGTQVSLRLLQEPGILDQLMETVVIPVKMIHVTRNPFDNISTISRKRFSGDLAQGIDYYFQLCAGVQSVRPRIEPQNWLDIRHEDFIQAPESSLRRLYNFVDVTPSADLLQDAASLIYKAPNKSRYDAPWTSQLIKTVEEEMTRYFWFDEYRYDS